MRRNTVLVVIVVLALVTSGTAGFAVGATPTGEASAASLDADAAVATPSAGAATGGTTPFQTGGGLVRGSPELSVTTPSATLTPGRTNELTLQISNDGDMDLGTGQTREIVTTARNVRVTADAGGTPLDVETGTLAIGSVTENRPGEATVAVNVPEDVEQGSYELDVELEYSYTYQQSGGVTIDREETVDAEVDVRISDDARFEVVNVTTDARIGGEGILEAEIENVGADVARDATVAFESASGGLAFGERASDAARIDELAPGETTTVRYDVGFAPGAPVREYALSGTVTFETSQGLQRVDESVSAGVVPGPEQRFSVTGVESDLHVGEEGEITGTVTNEGPDEARNVVIQFAEQSQNVIPIERSVAVGTLAPGESGEFRLPVEIGEEAKAIDRTADIAVRYRNAEFETRAYQDVELLYEVQPERDQFLVEVDDREIEAGGQRALEVTLTNNLDEPVRDVEARLFADSPLDSGNDEGFVSELAPGESTTLTFDLSAAGSGTAKTYPISFDFRYDDADGNSQLSDTTRVPITVVEGEGGFPVGLGLVALVAVVVIGAGAYVLQRE
ncbi:COG1361 S-layer family protein [Halorubrum sp. Eb13]|uniref:COG1361 S-layer family protein n=1 Tax=Halorubrum sp. Eb13 TaxID=1383843 RepID=UPI000B98DDEA|nr:COG1361 S-layer family protein [Halorubrum sp. Eb13]OYR41622.1 exo-alpha-sialidase [Halorubrum sp. Eb13]